MPTPLQKRAIKAAVMAFLTDCVSAEEADGFQQHVDAGQPWLKGDPICGELTDHDFTVVYSGHRVRITATVES